LLYELLAPLYAASGYREVSIKWTMMGLNLAALAGLLIVVRARAPMLGITVPLALVPLINREQRLFFWAWNPVAPLLPLALTIGVAAAVAAGDVSLLPLLCAVISFIVQAHVGFVPPVLLVVLTSFCLLTWQLLRHRISATPRQVAWSIAASMGVLLTLWALPLGHELKTPSGNLRAITEFFLTSPRQAHSWRAVFVIFANQFIGPLTPTWELTTGAASEAISWPVVMFAAVQLPLLLIVSVRAFRREAIYEGAFAALSLVAASAGVVAIGSIVGSVADYLIIWIAVIGALSLASIAAEALQTVGASSLARGSGWRWVLAAYLVSVAVVSGMRLADKHETEARSVTTRRLAEELDTYCRANGLDRPLLRFSDAGSDAAAGVLLQYYKQSRPIAVPDEWLFLVGDPFKSNGRETSEFYLMKEEEGALPDGVTNHIWLTNYGSHRLIRLFRATMGPRPQ
jgi:hypothetical protein